LKTTDFVHYARNRTDGQSQEIPIFTKRPTPNAAG
jgi:hypothetical protein